MPLKRVLSKIQSQIKDLALQLENFADPSVQPGVEDCEQLQKMLCELQENLAVYKFSRQDMEFSPSFMIHAKISEKEVPPAAPAGTAPSEHEAPPPPPAPPVKEPELPSPGPTAAPEPVRETAPPAETPRRPLSFALNDKFRFINELFAQNTTEYNVAYQQLSTVNSWQEAEIYLNSLKNLYQWPEKNEVVKHFYAQVKKRFE